MIMYAHPTNHSWFISIEKKTSLNSYGFCSVMAHRHQPLRFQTTVPDQPDCAGFIQVKQPVFLGEFTWNSPRWWMMIHPGTLVTTKKYLKKITEIPWNSQQQKPLKIDAWFRWFISFWVSTYFQGRLLLVLGSVNSKPPLRYIYSIWKEYLHPTVRSHVVIYWKPP